MLVSKKLFLVEWESVDWGSQNFGLNDFQIESFNLKIWASWVNQSDAQQCLVDIVISLEVCLGIMLKLVMQRQSDHPSWIIFQGLNGIYGIVSKINEQFRKDSYANRMHSFWKMKFIWWIEIIVAVKACMSPGPTKFDLDMSTLSWFKFLTG